MIPARVRAGHGATSWQRVLAEWGLAEWGLAAQPGVAGKPRRQAEKRKISAYIAVGRAKHPTRSPRHNGPLARAMATKLKRGGKRSRYRLRKQLPEPVFGQIKHARGFRQFLLRGVKKVSEEQALICTAHNLTKLMARA